MDFGTTLFAELNTSLQVLLKGVLWQCDDTHYNIRTRLRFALLRSVVTALRGVRGRKSGSGMKDLSNVNFDFVPEGEMYESF